MKLSKNHKLRVALFGGNGRMGQEIKELMAGSEAFELSAEINSQTKIQASEMKNSQVLIDFSQQAAFRKALDLALQYGLPFLSGTTGLTPADQKRLQQASRSIPVLWSPNMSLGVAALMKALEAFSAVADFDFQIEETHHRHKKDKPSGTALMLQRKLEEVLDRKVVAPLAIRGGGVFGHHQVHALGENESLIFEHRALNRKLFAQGALKAARWLSSKKTGHFDLKDILD